MEKIYYSLDQARRLLPEISRRFRKIRRIKEAVDLLESIEIESEDYSMEFDLVDLEIQKRYHKLMHNLFKEVQELTKVGIIVKDIDMGLVDIYSKFDGRDIFICWCFGELTIDHWHEVDAGYENRKSVSLIEKNNRSNFKHH